MSGKDASTLLTEDSALWNTVRDNVLFVLVRPEYAGNVGSAARVIANMGLKRLVLVNPCDYLSDEGRMLASGHNDSLFGAEVCDSIDQALADTGLVIGTSRRSGRHRLLTDTPADAVAFAADYVTKNRVAFVFGNEISGLSNSEFERCQRVAAIPTSPSAPSMNLSHAVAILAYELRSFFISEGAAELHVRQKTLIPRQEIEYLYQYWEKLVRILELEKCTSVAVTMRRIRRVFDRAELDFNELGMLRKIVKRAAWWIEHPENHTVNHQVNRPVKNRPVSRDE